MLCVLKAVCHGKQTAKCGPYSNRCTSKWTIEKKNATKKTIPYHLLRLLQQTMMIRSTDHHDLSVECQAQDYQILLNKKVDLSNL